MKNLTQITEELRVLLSDLEAIIGENKDDELFVLNDSYLNDMSISLDGYHAESTYTVTDDDFEINLTFDDITLDNTKKA